MLPRQLLFQLGPLFSSGLNVDHNELILTSHSDFTLIQGIFVYIKQFQGLKIRTVYLVADYQTPEQRWKRMNSLTRLMVQLQKTRFVTLRNCRKTPGISMLEHGKTISII